MFDFSRRNFLKCLSVSPLLGLKMDLAPQMRYLPESPDGNGQRFSLLEEEDTFITFSERRKEGIVLFVKFTEKIAYSVALKEFVLVKSNTKVLHLEWCRSKFSNFYEQSMKTREHLPEYHDEDEAALENYLKARKLAKSL